MPDPTDPITPLEVAVVDPDLLWAVDIGNAVRPLYAETFHTVTEALDHLAADRPAVVVVGPGVEDPDEEVLARLAGTNPALSAVLVVADLSRERAESLLDAGAEVVLGDDVGRDALAEAVREAAAAGVVAAAAAAGAATATAGSVGGRSPATVTVVLVTAAKGGEGTSTVAANLAAVLAHRRHRVVLVDCDPSFGDLPMLLGLPAPPVVDEPADLVPGEAALRDAVAVHPHTGVRLAVLPRLRDGFTVLPGEAVRRALWALEAEADVVVLDAPFHAVQQGDYTASADRLVLVTLPALTSVKNAVIALEAIGGRERLSVVVNRLADADRGHRGHRDHGRLPEPDEIAEALHHPVATALPDDEEVVHLAGTGHLSAEGHEDEPLRAAVERLADALALPPPS
ncbi:MAG: P-loop NTPase [Acidimicrobiales bacterium]